MAKYRLKPCRHHVTTLGNQLVIRLTDKSAPSRYGGRSTLRHTELVTLILTRREGESTLISIPGSEDTIEVRVMKAGNQVSLGIDAPLEVEVLREELLQG